MNAKQRRTIERWTTALRSGDYRQGDLALRRNNSFCCHGVLLDVLEPDGWVAPEQFGRRYWHTSGQGPHGVDMMPSQQWFTEVTGLTREDRDRLAGLNDSGRSFNEIADEIEARAARE